MYRFGDRSIIKYRVGAAEIHESPSLAFIDKLPVFTRHLNLGKRTEDLVIQTAKVDGPAAIKGNVAIVAEERNETESAETRSIDGLQFDGAKFGEIAAGKRFDLNESDYSIYARIKTRSDGTIFAQTKNQDQWMPQGKTFFLRGGRPTFDIGWVGAVHADRRVDDGKWHEVCLLYTSPSPRDATLSRMPSSA